MEYISVKSFAQKFNISERTVRNYCSSGRIPGAFLTGKTWNIPSNAVLPSKLFSDNPILNVLKEQKDMRLHGGLYHYIQVELTYNSNHIEGSRLSHDQTRYIFETNTIGVTTESINVDDIVETVNHFRCIDFIIDEAKSPLTESFIKRLHQILKSGTQDSTKDWFRVGDYKALPNEVGGHSTTSPLEVSSAIRSLLKEYNSSKTHSFEHIVDFHQRFESIHPFQDGNGRVGRLIMFKECLAHNVVPFIITDDIKMFYYRGLSEWPHTKGYLLDTCLTAQDRMHEVIRHFNPNT